MLHRSEAGWLVVTQNDKIKFHDRLVVSKLFKEIVDDDDLEI